MSTDDKNNAQHLWLVYDGACPLCSASARALKIRQAVGHLHLINAREEHPIIDEINKAGLNLDNGMVVKLNNTLYYGADAQQILAMIGTKRDWFNRLNVLLFRSKLFARLSYAILRMTRNTFLLFRGVSKINNLKKEAIFKSIFGKDWENLSPVMHKHYANRPYSHDVVTVYGKMDIDCSGIMALLLPFFKLFNVLVPYVGKNIPVTVHFRSYPNSPAFHLDRIFHFTRKKPYHFRSYMLQVRENRVIETLFFGIGWRMHYHYNGKKIILKHDGYVWKIGRVTIPLPLDLLIGKVYAEEEAISDDSFRMKMEITHPLFGHYAYRGEFKTKTPSITDSSNE